MMNIDRDRQHMRAERNLQIQADLAAQNREREARADLYKALSQQRVGDKTLSVCNAASGGGFDARTGVLVRQGLSEPLRLVGRPTRSDRIQREDPPAQPMPLVAGIAKAGLEQQPARGCVLGPAFGDDEAVGEALAQNRDDAGDCFAAVASAAGGAADPISDFDRVFSAQMDADHRHENAIGLGPEKAILHRLAAADEAAGVVESEGGLGGNPPLR